MMKTYLKNVLFFLAPLIVLAYPLDMFLSHNLKQSNEYNGELEVWNDIYNSNIHADLAIYGSSRAWVHINPEILEDSLNLKVYNFGIDGHNFWLQHLRHLEYLEYNPNPKHIILAVDFGSLQKRDNLYLYEQFLPYMLWNKNITEYTKLYKGYHYFDYYIPLLRYVGQPTVIKKSFCLFLDRSNSPTFRQKGYRAVDKKWTDKFELAKAKSNNYAIKMDSMLVNLLDNFIIACKKENIQVTLVYTPEYIEVDKIINNRKTIIENYQSLADKHQIHFLDYSENVISYDRENFYGATHLNKTGSVLFSKKLAMDLFKLE